MLIKAAKLHYLESARNCLKTDQKSLRKKCPYLELF